MMLRFDKAGYQEKRYPIYNAPIWLACLKYFIIKIIKLKRYHSKTLQTFYFRRSYNSVNLFRI